MFKSIYTHILFVCFALFFLTVSTQANYYHDMKKIDRKIYVAVTQQKMLTKRMKHTQKKLFSGSRTKAYKEMIAKIHSEELVYRSRKKRLQKKIYRAERNKRANAKNVSKLPGNIYIKVDKRRQTMKVYKGKVLIYTWLCSTGKKGYTTPSGRYNPYHATEMHYSKKWDMAPMPYSVFYYKGFAIHGTNAVRRLGSIASHGCIRLSTRNAKKIYHLARKYGYKRMHIRIV